MDPYIPASQCETKDGDYEPFGEPTVELSLLLPGWQAAALESAAHSEGLTTAQLLRRLIQDYLPVGSKHPVSGEGGERLRLPSHSGPSF